jgi:hypothetical protein
MAINRKQPTPKTKKKKDASLLSPAAKLKMRQAIAKKAAMKKKR